MIKRFWLRAPNVRNALLSLEVEFLVSFIMDKVTILSKLLKFTLQFADKAYFIRLTLIIREYKCAGGERCQKFWVTGESFIDIGSVCAADCTADGGELR